MTTTLATSPAAEPAPIDAVEFHSWSVSQLRSDRRRLERLLEVELSLRDRRDPVVLEAELIEERHAVQLAELVARLRLVRHSRG
jgi:hypothetical protein